MDKGVYTLSGERYTDKSGCVAFVMAGKYDSLVPHGHDFIEIAYVAEGYGVHEADGKKIPTKKGDLFVLADWKSVHRFVPDAACGDFSLYNLVVPYGKFDLNLSRIQPGSVFTGKDVPRLGELFAVVREEYENKRFGYRTIVDSVALCILQLVLRCRKENADSGYAEKFGGDYVEIAKDYVSRNFAFPLTVADVADACCVSPSYLQELFKKKSTLSVKQYLLNERLRQCCYRLLETDLCVEKVARACGFTDMKFFYAQFKKFYKTTPDRYRKLYKEGTSERLNGIDGV